MRAVRDPECVISSGHGLSSRVRGKWDSGAVGGKLTEAAENVEMAGHVTDNLRALKYCGMRAEHRGRGYFALADDDALKFFTDSNRARNLLFLELHCDSSTNTAAHGSSVYLHREASDAEERAAEIVLRRICVALGTEPRGVKHENFAVLAQQPMVSLLVERYFISNAGDRKLAEKYHVDEELALTNSVLEYFGWPTVQTRPRFWGPVRRAAYKAKLQTRF